MTIRKTFERASLASIIFVCGIAGVAADPPSAPTVAHGSRLLRPRWTRAKPHFEHRGGKAFAVAVGQAQDQKDRALARVTAEERARADILRLIQGKPSSASASGQVNGVVPVQVYEASGGTVYVRVELEMPAGATP
jgi:hypothetical protein